MSNKELIKEARGFAGDGSTFQRVIKELCDALEEHQPTPFIRKGEVYAFRSETYPVGFWSYSKAGGPLTTGTSIGGTHRRKLTDDEMPLPEDE